MKTILVISLLFVIVVLLTGGIWWYFKKFRTLTKEFGEFLQVVFKALSDKKLTNQEKEQVMKELLDMKPVLSEIKVKFVDDVEELGEDIKNLYIAIKNKIKGEK